MNVRLVKEHVYTEAGHVCLAQADFGFFPSWERSIELCDIPRYLFDFAEENIEEILTHEIIHFVLFDLEDNESSIKFDYFFGQLGSLTRFLADGVLETKVFWRS